MRNVRLLGGLLWTLNVLLGAGTIVAAFRFLIFPDAARANPIAHVVEDATIPEPPRRPQQVNYAYLRSFQNPVEPRTADSGILAPSDIRADLLGTVVSPDDPREGIAYLGVPARNVFFNAYCGEPVLLDGEPVPELAGWKLVGVTRETATFSNGAKETVLRIKESLIGGAGGPGGAVIPSGLVPPDFDRSKLNVRKIASSNDSETYTIDRTSIAWATANQDLLLNEVGLQDYSSGGIQIVSMAPGSLAEQFGLRPNDVIRSVNGQPITNALKLAELRNSPVIQRATALTIGIERAGQVRALVIRPTR